MVSGFYFSLGFFTILYASKGSRSFPGGGLLCCALCPGVVDWHNCGAILDALESGLGIGWYNYLHSMTFLVGMGPL